MVSDIHTRIRQYQITEREEDAAFLLKHFRSLIEMSARKLSRTRPDLYEDLFQVGQISLLRSLLQYDEELGHSFEPYAMTSLVGHMKNYLRDKSWYIQVPRRIKEKGTQIQRAIDRLTMNLNRSPEIAEIAHELKLSEEETIEILAGRDYYQLASLDVPLSNDEGSAVVGDLVAAAGDDYHQADNRMLLEKAMQGLEEQEKIVLQLIYKDGLSQRMIADKLGISQMSVSRIQRRAVVKMRDDLDMEQL